MDLPIKPLREITYHSVQRHRARVHQTMRDASKMAPVNFVDMFDAGAFDTKKKKKKKKQKQKKKNTTDDDDGSDNAAAHRKHTGELASARDT
jgi:hypothetical protein